MVGRGRMSGGDGEGEDVWSGGGGRRWCCGFDPLSTHKRNHVVQDSIPQQHDAHDVGDCRHYLVVVPGQKKRCVRVSE